MKKILIADFLFEEAHRNVNTNLIECIAEYDKVTIFDVNGYYKNEKERWNKQGIQVVNYKLGEKKTGMLKSRLYSIEIMKLVKRELCRQKYNLMIVLGFDILAYALGRIGFGKVPIALFHHKNIDELTNSAKKMAFRSYQDRVHHIVFENFFKDYLVQQIGVKDEKCHVIPHPAIPTDSANTEILEAYDCIGLCNSNSEQFIDNMLLMNEKLKKKGLHVLLRSKQDKVSESNVSIIKGFLELNIYYGYIRNARSVLVPIPDTYIYRLSGSIYDALSRRKMVMTTSKYYGEDYKKRYPGICLYVENEQAVIKMLVELDKYEGNESSFDEFINEHSKENISKVMKQVFNSITR